VIKVILDDRKKRILEAIVEDYISSSEPVGSATIAKSFNMKISSATIRNEMAELEELGYLEQPHTSAGRIPSDKGYRYYVDWIMKISNLPETEIEKIRLSFRKDTDEIDEFIKRAADALSKTTNYTTIAVAPHLTHCSIDNIKIIGLDNRRVLVTFVTDSGITKDFVVKCDYDIITNNLEAINNIINDIFKGIEIEQLDKTEAMQVNKDFRRYINIFNEVIKGVKNLKNLTQNDLYTEGTSYIFNFPEFNNIQKARDFISLIDSKDMVYEMFSPSNEGINIKIGNENKYNEAKDFSIISCSYDIDSKVAGSIGVIGPRRINYSKAISYIRFIKDYLNESIKKKIL
jgi:heat-inducible transcriptional repressor